MTDSTPPLEIRVARPDEWDAVADVTYYGFNHGVPGGRKDPPAPRLALLRDAAGRAKEGDLLVAVDPASTPGSGSGSDSGSDSGKIVGTATLLPPGSSYNRQARDDEAELKLLAVLPEARRRGAARALMIEAINRARDWGVPALVLDTGPRNEASQSLYAGLGFARVPERETQRAMSGGMLVVLRYDFAVDPLLAGSPAASDNVDRESLRDLVSGE